MPLKDYPELQKYIEDQKKQKISDELFDSSKRDVYSDFSPYTDLPIDENGNLIQAPIRKDDMQYPEQLRDVYSDLSPYSPIVKPQDLEKSQLEDATKASDIMKKANQVMPTVDNMMSRDLGITPIQMKDGSFQYANSDVPKTNAPLSSGTIDELENDQLVKKQQLQKIKDLINKSGIKPTDKTSIPPEIMMLSEARTRRDLLSALGQIEQAGEKISTGMASRGGHALLKPDTSVGEGFKKQGERIYSDVLENLSLAEKRKQEKLAIVKQQADDKYKQDMLDLQRMKLIATRDKEAGKLKTKQDVDDEKRYFEVLKRTNGLMRGGKLLNDVRKQLNGVYKLDNILDDFRHSTRPVTKQDAYDISATISTLIMGGVPAQSLVDATIIKNAVGEGKTVLQYLTGKPNSYYNKDQLDFIQKQVDTLRRTNVDLYKNAVEKSEKTLKQVFERQPQLKEDWDDAWEKDLYMNMQKNKTKAKETNSQIDQAKSWLEKNPNHPKAEEVKAKLIRIGAM